MKKSISKILFLSLFIFFASESKALTEFTWVNSTGCALTVRIFDAGGTLLHTSSTCCGPAACIAGTPASFTISDGTCTWTQTFGMTGTCTGGPLCPTSCLCNAAASMIANYFPSGGGTLCGPLPNGLITINI
jgi:hypothetical protein